MNFNRELYRQYRRAAGRQEKDGICDVTRYPNGLYCFEGKDKNLYHVYEIRMNPSS